MSATLGEHYLDDVLLQLRKLRGLADAAVRQVSDEQLFRPLGEGGNSIAIVMKHMAGNMRSRWTDFLTSDGEKPDRGRDLEFVREAGDDRDGIASRWERGWRCTLDAITALAPDDLMKTVTIRGEPHTVVEAIDRQLSHYAYHVGQIVLLARHFAGDGWQWLSIPPGESAEYEVSKDGRPYDVDEGGAG